MVFLAVGVGLLTGCGKPVLRMADASLGDYYTDKEYERLSEEERREYCQELADQDSVYRWYAQLADALDMGLMVYDQSWRREGTGLSLPLFERLAAIDNVVSLKYGSPAYFNDMIVALDRFSDRFAFVENSLGFTSTISFMHGGTGFISGPALWWPAYELEFHHVESMKMTHAKTVQEAVEIAREKMSRGEAVVFPYGGVVLARIVREP